jgi:hypothetical protein
MGIDGFDFDSLTDEQFNKFIWSLDALKAKLNRVSVEELEREFEGKSVYLLENEHYDLVELEVGEFVDTVFERKALGNGEVVVPFEEIQSREYRLWLSQKMRNRRTVREGEASPLQLSSPLIDYSGYRMWRYNPVIFYKDGGKARHRLMLLDDEETLRFLENREFAIMSPVTYVGRTNSYRNARYLYAFAIDLDGVSIHEVRALLRGMTTGVYPVANIIVNSGHGVHVYYLLESPVGMYETRLDALNKMKAGLTRIVWLVSKLDTPQVQSVVQGFRLPGTKTKFGKPIRAFWNRNAPLHTLDELNGFLGIYKLSDEEIGQLKEKHPHNPARVTLEEARKRWPEWYASRVIGRNRVGKKWNINRGLYDWWLAKLKDGSEVTVHHRYWCVLTLVVYAVKCGIPREEVLNDALALVPAFDRKTETVDNPFSEDDVRDAMRAYDEQYCKWPLRVIETTTGIRIERNKRNGRDRNAHIKLMNFVRDSITHTDKNWRKGNGRKSVESIVREWQEQHPGCKNKSLCARETGLTRPTVHRWWNESMAVPSDNAE